MEPISLLCWEISRPWISSSNSARNPIYYIDNLEDDETDNNRINDDGASVNSLGDEEFGIAEKEANMSCKA